jgi:hypothetical protein
MLSLGSCGKEDGGLYRSGQFSAFPTNFMFSLPAAMTLSTKGAKATANCYSPIRFIIGVIENTLETTGTVLEKLNEANLKAQFEAAGTLPFTTTICTDPTPTVVV